MVRVSKDRKIDFLDNIYFFFAKNAFLTKLHFRTHFYHDFFSGAKNWFLTICSTKYVTCGGGVQSGQKVKKNIFPENSTHFQFF